jgi:hypothetical protein
MRVSLPGLDRKAIVGTDKCGSDFAISWQRIFREAQLYWPRNTAKHVARITGCSVRTAYRWLAKADGRKGAEPSGSDVVAVVLALRAEYVARGRIFEQLDLGLD